MESLTTQVASNIPLEKEPDETPTENTTTSNGVPPSSPWWMEHPKLVIARSSEEDELVAQWFSSLSTKATYKLPGEVCVAHIPCH